MNEKIYVTAKFNDSGIQFPSNIACYNYILKVFSYLLCISSHASFHLSACILVSQVCGINYHKLEGLRNRNVLSHLED